MHNETEKTLELEVEESGQGEVAVFEIDSSPTPGSLEDRIKNDPWSIFAR